MRLCWCAQTLMGWPSRSISIQALSASYPKKVIIVSNLDGSMLICGRVTFWIWNSVKFGPMRVETLTADCRATKFVQSCLQICSTSCGTLGKSGLKMDHPKISCHAAGGLAQWAMMFVGIRLVACVKVWDLLCSKLPPLFVFTILDWPTYIWKKCWELQFWMVMP